MHPQKKLSNSKMIINSAKMKNTLENNIINTNGNLKSHILQNIINFIKKFQEFS